MTDTLRDYKIVYGITATAVYLDVKLMATSPVPTRNIRVAYNNNNARHIRIEQETWGINQTFLVWSINYNMLYQWWLKFFYWGAYKYKKISVGRDSTKNNYSLTDLKKHNVRNLFCFF